MPAPPIGSVFGRLTVIAAQDAAHKVLCRCMCGNTKRIYYYSLGRYTNSCGCDRAEKSGNRTRTHGLRSAPEYPVWNTMISRCHRNTKSSHCYRDRGIVVCDRWRTSFDNFIADMGRRPSPAHTLERINNDGNYEPNNCRWATRKEQARNMRDNRNITFNGETKCLVDWARERGLKRQALEMRLKRGWPLARALGFER